LCASVSYTILLRCRSGRNFLGAAGTVLTESTDPIDPDLIRADSAWLRFGQALVTDHTRTVGDPVDPDIMRAASVRWAVESAATLITRVEPDVPDRHARRRQRQLNYGAFLLGGKRCTP
jgi:hypothetical protein